MNYYIQGDAAKADKIKAAFEKLGYEKVNVIHIGDYANERLFFFTENGKVRSTLKDCGIVHIIKTHPDYKELELPIEPKFKVGDRIRWINHDVQNQTITDIKDDSYITVNKYGIKCALKFTKQDEWELVQPKPHYDIANFKPFDKVLVRDRNNEPWRIAFYGYYNEEANYSHFVGTCWSKQCIPYNDDTKHLLGTTDMPSEEYINW